MEGTFEATCANDVYDDESAREWARGVIDRQLSNRLHSSYRTEEGVDMFDACDGVVQVVEVKGGQPRFAVTVYGRWHAVLEATDKELPELYVVLALAPNLPGYDD